MVRDLWEKKRGQKKINIDKIKDTGSYVNELTHIVNSKIAIKTFCSKLDNLESDMKDKISNKEGLDNIIAYLESYKKILKILSDYQSNSLKTLRDYEVKDKPNKKR